MRLGIENKPCSRMPSCLFRVKKRTEMPIRTISREGRIDPRFN